jgi:hypothetical protein
MRERFGPRIFFLRNYFFGENIAALTMLQICSGTAIIIGKTSATDKL